MLWRIVTPLNRPKPFVAGLIVWRGVVREAAPIIRWTKGKRWDFCKAYFTKKGFSGEPVRAVKPGEVD